MISIHHKQHKQEEQEVKGVLQIMKKITVIVSSPSCTMSSSHHIQHEQEEQEVKGVLQNQPVAKTTSVSQKQPRATCKE
jgi:hypothetical protein